MCYALMHKTIPVAELTLDDKLPLTFFITRK
jgi:hypothetical protein